MEDNRILNAAGSSELFTPWHMGSLSLANRLVMAPMTRQRADDNGVPGDLMVTYFGQRASAGLMLTDCTMVDALSHAYPNCPGLYSTEQVAGWRRVTDRVHARGGKIFAQIWHCGRRSHPALLDGALPIGVSPVANTELIRTLQGKLPAPVPRVLSLAEVSTVVEQFARAARYAQDAGFDGVELHGGNGYLVDQFLRSGSNQRTDVYGGSISRRLRFLLEVAEALVGVWGDDRVGVKLTPANSSNGMSDGDPQSLFDAAVAALNGRGLAYLQIVEPIEAAEVRLAGDPALRNLNTARYRRLFSGRLMANGGYDGVTAATAIKEGQADLVSFGRLFLANPDLPPRFRNAGPFNKADPDSFYGGDARGYTDYPFLTDPTGLTGIHP